MTFENFLKEIHAVTYTGTGDSMPDAFDNWLASLGFDDYETYAERYAQAEVALALEASRIAKAND